MVRFKINVAQALKDKGYTSYKFLKNGLIKQGTLTKLNRDPEKIDINLTLKTLDIICQLLECRIEDIVEIVPDKEIEGIKEN